LLYCEEFQSFRSSVTAPALLYLLQHPAVVLTRLTCIPAGHAAME